MSRSSQSTYSFTTSAKTSGGIFGANKEPSGLSSSLSSSSKKKKKDEDPIIKNVDMTEDMQKRAIDVAQEALQKFDTEKDRAAYVKKAFDVEFDTTWHVVVGKHFASFVTHESKCFIYVYFGPIAFLLWKSG